MFQSGYFRALGVFAGGFCFAGLLRFREAVLANFGVDSVQMGIILEDWGEYIDFRR